VAFLAKEIRMVSRDDIDEVAQFFGSGRCAEKLAVGADGALPGGAKALRQSSAYELLLVGPEVDTAVAINDVADELIVVGTHSGLGISARLRENERGFENCPQGGGGNFFR
jgi:hypothetical protein